MQLRILITLTTLTIVASAHSQNSSPYWSTLGNSNATSSSKLGTTNAINLRLFTNNVERLRVTTTGYVGIGTTAPNARLHFDAPAGTSLLRGTVAGSTKLYMSSAGGLTIGAGVAAPANGLYVAGNVGIGTGTPQYPLDVVNATSNLYVMRATSTFSGTQYVTAVYGHSINAPGYGYGVKGEGGFIGVMGYGEGGSYPYLTRGVYAYVHGNPGAGERRAVDGRAEGGAYAYGVYGYAAVATTFNAAGYFNGSLWAVGPLNNISDRKFKQDIEPVDHGLEQLLKLKPSVYTFKTSEYKSMQLPQGRQLGLIADEVKDVFPELVSKAVHPAEYDKADVTKVVTPEITYEGINYQGLIPVLIASIQELKAEVDKHEQRNNALEAKVAELSQLVLEMKSSRTNTLTSTSAYLKQNSPNPVDGKTTIRYSVPETTTAARLELTDAKGQIVKAMALASRGSGQVDLNTANLASGAYNYTLYVNGKAVDTKRLVIAR